MAGASDGAAAGRGWRWDVALSFAGAQRTYVGQVAQALKERGVRCFYDADEQTELWRKYLAEELPDIYGGQAAAVVVFVSAEYVTRDWARLERRAALARAVRERREYVLPARFDDTPLPGMPPDMSYVDLRARTPRQCAAMIADKLATLGITPQGQAGEPSSDRATGTVPPVRHSPASVPSVLAGTLTGHIGRVYDVAFSPDGRLLASIGEDTTIRLWDTASRAQLRALTGRVGKLLGSAIGLTLHPHLSVAFSPDGRLLALGCEDQTIQLWDAGSGAHVRTLAGYRGWPGCVAFSPDGQLLASAGADVRIWDPGSSAYLYTLGNGQRVAFSPDGRLVASAGWDQNLLVWDLSSRAQLHRIEGAGGCVAFSPDSRLLASAGEDKLVRIWDPDSGERLNVLTGHTREVKSVAFSPDGQLLASGGHDGRVQLWS